MKTFKLITIILTVLLVSCEKQPLINEEPAIENKVTAYVDHNIYEDSDYTIYSIDNLDITTTEKENGYKHTVTMTGKGLKVHFDITSTKEECSFNHTLVTEESENYITKSYIKINNIKHTDEYVMLNILNYFDNMSVSFTFVDNQLITGNYYGKCL